MENADLLKQLREETGISMMECKKALDEAKWDIKRAKEILREKGKEMVKGRSERTMSKGIVEAYIHMGGKIGVMLELLCESDFVAKSDEFKKLAHEIALQAAATKPLFVKSEDISGELKKGGAFIPGIRPGSPTKKYLEFVVTRITFAGALFLGCIAVLPSLAQMLTNIQSLAIGGTGVLIVVSVILETTKQAESMLVEQNYDRYI